MKYLKSNIEKKGNIMKRSAFTMIELIMVVVVLGLLASLAIPRMDRDLRQEAETNIVSALRYTQNLAMSDDKTDPRDLNWQKKLWQLRFGSYDSGKKWFYTISSDENDQGNVNKNETAIDLSNGKYMYNLAGDSTIDDDESPNIFISEKYGVEKITVGGDCSAQHIAFDHLGRVHASLGAATNNNSSYRKTACTILVEFETTGIDDLNITIQPETGYISAS